ncbi:MAG TPA: DUF6160 family protein [Paucimonas sp.]|nr:DUF6160 family protein [Paucimonas sp.]
MKFSLIKKTAIAAALSSFALGASAMTTIDDADLSKVSGQDGVSIAVDLNINVGEFRYTDTDTDGGSVSFNNIRTTGTIAATLDVISGATFATLGTGEAYTVLGLDPTAANTQANIAAFYGGGDVVKIAIPDLDVTAGHTLSQTIDSIRMGGSTKSFGSFAMNNIRLQGTTAYIWAH